MSSAACAAYGFSIKPDQREGATPRSGTLPPRLMVIRLCRSAPAGLSSVLVRTCPLLSVSVRIPSFAPRGTLHSASLHSASLHSARLHSARLHSARLHRASLHSASLHSARLHSASLHSASLHSASLHSASLHSASLHSASLHSASLHSASLHSASRPPVLSPPFSAIFPRPPDFPRKTLILPKNRKILFLRLDKSFVM